VDNFELSAVIELDFKRKYNVKAYPIS
jgi:hypothetical protein